MEDLKKSFKPMLIFISYFIYQYFQAIPLALLGIDYNSLPLNLKVIYLLAYELVYIIIIIFLYKETFKNNIKDFIENIKYYLHEYPKYWAFAFFLMMVSNIFILLLFPNSTATNQENINLIFNKAPAYIIISSALFAPLIEESIFRLSLRKIFKTDTLFIIMSGFAFGAMHVVSSFESFSDLIYIITYSIPGFVFAYTLVKSENIFVPISLHMFHNTLTVIMQIILLILS